MSCERNLVDDLAWFTQEKLLGSIICEDNQQTKKNNIPLLPQEYMVHKTPVVHFNCITYRFPLLFLGVCERIFGGVTNTNSLN